MLACVAVWVLWLEFVAACLCLGLVVLMWCFRLCWIGLVWAGLTDWGLDWMVLVGVDYLIGCLDALRVNCGTSVCF